ncbi:hypothetical protein [Burkholderia cepacia]|uniref:hypothetical protein n=1 Tax=Burkholderia cepacia TaxID=292 RepID=UPI0005513E69|nr:hypothetical protein [Burkholderia cepacia]
MFDRAHVGLLGDRYGTPTLGRRYGAVVDSVGQHAIANDRAYGAGASYANGRDARVRERHRPRDSVDPHAAGRNDRHPASAPTASGLPQAGRPVQSRMDARRPNRDHSRHPGPRVRETGTLGAGRAPDRHPAAARCRL